MGFLFPLWIHAGTRVLKKGAVNLQGTVRLDGQAEHTPTPVVGRQKVSSGRVHGHEARPRTHRGLPIQFPKRSVRPTAKEDRNPPGLPFHWSASLAEYRNRPEGWTAR